MPGSVPIPSLVTLISATVAPVVLVSSAAILLGAVSARYNAVASQFRVLAAEFRQPGLDPERKRVVQKQLALFDTRINAAWLSSMLLSCAIVLFLISMLELFLETHYTGAASFALWPILGGLVCVTLSLVADVVEIAYGRRTLHIERMSCCEPPEERPRVEPTQR